MAPSLCVFPLHPIASECFSTTVREWGTDPQSQAPIPASSTSTSGSVSGSVAYSLARKGNPAELGPTVRIGPGDDLDIAVFGLTELSQHARFGSSGDVSMPLIGYLHLAGLSSDEAQTLIERLLA